MTKFKHLLGPVLLFLVIDIVSCSPGKDEDVVKEIKKSLETIPKEKFKGDALMVQTKDRQNAKTNYRLDGRDKSDLSYTRGVIEKDDVDVVVLSSEEDKLVFEKTKRIFIVLKKSAGDPKKFNTFIAIVRDAVAQDTNTTTVDGKKIVIEWDIWDEHFVFGGSRAGLGIVFCTSAFTTPCYFNEVQLKNTSASLVASPPVSLSFIGEKDTDKVKISEKDYDIEANYDYFRDLEKNGAAAGRDALGGVGALLGGLPLVGGLVGGLAGGGGGGPMAMLSGVAGMASSLPIVGGLASMIPGVGGGGGGGPLDMLKGFGLGRKKRDTASDDLEIKPGSLAAKYPGWKTQFIKVEKGTYSKREKDGIFFGFGNCPAIDVSIKDLEKAKTNDEYLDFYTKVLRIDCLYHLRFFILRLLNDKIIQFTDQGIHVTDSAKATLANSAKLSFFESVDLTAAVDLCGFTGTYVAEMKNATAVEAPDGTKTVSRSIHFLAEKVLRTMDIWKTQSRVHFMHFARFTLQTLENAFDKVREDEANLNACKDCKEDQEYAKNDRIYLMGLIQFVKYGKGLWETQDPRKAFTDFYKANKAVLEKRVNKYDNPSA